MISVISDWVLATVRAIGLVPVELILRWLHSLSIHRACPANCAGLRLQWNWRRPVRIRPQSEASSSSFGNPRQMCKSRKAEGRPNTSKMDKIAGLKEILALDPKNSFARYGVAMELASRGETAAALDEFDTLLKNDPDYTAGYFMAAQTLTAAGRTAEAIERLKAGIGCAARSDNRHALSEMQAMLDDLER
jgi:predicted Zn-dependent protease